jgi:hypothetical protein
MGCLSLAILFAAAIFILGPQIRPMLSECMKIESEVAMVQREMRQVLSSIQRFREAKGKYPPDLQALVPSYVSDRSGLKFSQNQQGPTFKYTVPAGSSADEFPVLEYTLTYKTPDGRTIPVSVLLAPNGEFNKDAVPEQCRAFVPKSLD